jgi:hypothetical protein
MLQAREAAVKYSSRILVFLKEPEQDFQCRGGCAMHSIRHVAQKLCSLGSRGKRSAQECNPSAKYEKAEAESWCQRSKDSSHFRASFFGGTVAVLTDRRNTRRDQLKSRAVMFLPVGTYTRGRKLQIQHTTPTIHYHHHFRFPIHHHRMYQKNSSTTMMTKPHPLHRHTPSTNNRLVQCPSFSVSSPQFEWPQQEQPFS